MLWLIDHNCYNCTEIIIDGTSKENNDIVYKKVGDDVQIVANVSTCHAKQSVVLRFNDSDTTTSNYSGSCSQNGSSYNCNNLTTNDTGVYYIHVTLDDTLLGSLWCTNNVIMIIQCKEKYIMIQ